MSAPAEPNPRPALRCPYCSEVVAEGMRFPTCAGCGRVLDVDVLRDNDQRDGKGGAR